MNLGCFHQDCIEKLNGKHVPRLARTEGEIGNRWIVVHVWDSDEEVQGIGWNRR